MLDSLKRVFQSIAGGDDSPSAEDPHEGVRIATCALLLETALADSDLSPEEFRKIEELLVKHFGLTDRGVGELMEAAKQEHSRSTDLWRFAREINQHMSRDQKLKVMEMIWRVVYADGTMDKFEAYITQTLHRLLRIDHPTFIALKLKVKCGKKG